MARRSPRFDYESRFWAKVQKSDGCWLWTGLRDASGYGRATYRRRHVDLAHRVSWRFTHGEIPDESCVLHHCDNPPCVRPDHLFLGDRGDNARDMAAKGRQHVQRNPGDQPRCPPDRLARGERHYRARLTADQVIEIRRRFAAGERKAPLCRAYGISMGGLTSIVEGISWRHVGGPVTSRKVSA